MKKLIKLWHYLINSIIYFFWSDTIVVSAHVNVKYGKIVHTNWGDDLNVYLIEQMTGKRVVIANKSLYHIITKSPNFVCIGSILGWVGNRNSTIWGAGFMDGTHAYIHEQFPKTIASVRGKLSYNILVENGLTCSPVWGDPALLISKYYHPSRKIRYRMGIVPHIIDKENQMIKEFVANHDDVILIDLANYDRWTDVVDEIMKCEFVISSSLHGLIAADSYAISNAWVSFSNDILGGTFKYLDYFSSIGRSTHLPIAVREANSLIKIYEDGIVAENVTIDYKGIIDTCPFKNFLKSPIA